MASTETPVQNGNGLLATQVAPTESQPSELNATFSALPPTPPTFDQPQHDHHHQPNPPLPSPGSETLPADFAAAGISTAQWHSFQQRVYQHQQQHGDALDEKELHQKEPLHQHETEPTASQQHEQPQQTDQADLIPKQEHPTQQQHEWAQNFVVNGAAEQAPSAVDQHAAWQQHMFAAYAGSQSSLSTLPPPTPQQPNTPASTTREHPSIISRATGGNVTRFPSNLKPKPSSGVKAVPDPEDPNFAIITETRDEVTGKVKKLFRCAYPGCGKVCNRLYNLKSHVLVHSNTRPFQCEHCSMSFARRHDLQRHLRSTHQKEKSFICDRCGLSFTRADAYRRHLIVEEKKRTGQPMTQEEMQFEVATHAAAAAVAAAAAAAAASSAASTPLPTSTPPATPQACPPASFSPTLANVQFVDHVANSGLPQNWNVAGHSIPFVAPQPNVAGASVFGLPPQPETNGPQQPPRFTFPKPMATAQQHEQEPLPQQEQEQPSAQPPPAQQQYPESQQQQQQQAHQQSALGKDDPPEQYIPPAPPAHQHPGLSVP
ncbi:hypothetical protein DFJ77DRAFT_513841 [Powellomyces hirtus]|nr:hypothetical protein DFJ77DRAFT_513841 [Powellomyces hirtus]